MIYADKFQFIIVVRENYHMILPLFDRNPSHKKHKFEPLRSQTSTASHFATKP